MQMQAWFEVLALIREVTGVPILQKALALTMDTIYCMPGPPPFKYLTRLVSLYPDGLGGVIPLAHQGYTTVGC